MMGQHKYNETAKLAKEGKLPPKEKGMSKRQQERYISEFLRQVTGAAMLQEEMKKANGGESYNDV